MLSHRPKLENEEETHMHTAVLALTHTHTHYPGPLFDSVVKYDIRILNYGLDGRYGVGDKPVL